MEHITILNVSRYFSFFENMAWLEVCDFGRFLEDECHKLSYCRSVGKRILMPSDEIDAVLLWRARMVDYMSPEASVTICYHHEAKFGAVFERKFTKCCDVCNLHKKAVKGGFLVGSYAGLALKDCKIHQVMIVLKNRM